MYKHTHTLTHLYQGAIDSIVTAVTAGQNFDQHLTADHADFGALTFDRIEFQPLTVDDYVHIYGSIWKNV